MVKLLIFVILIILVISSFSLDLSFFVEGFNLIINSLGDIPQILQAIGSLINAVINSPILRTLILLGIAFLILKWLLGLVGDNDENHKYKD